MGIDDMFTEANFAGFMAEFNASKHGKAGGSLLFQKSRLESNTTSDDEASGTLSSLSDEFPEVLATVAQDPAAVEAPGRLQQREKQIRIGKTTHGYQQYLLKIPKEFRDVNCMDTPPTSPRSLTMSKRNWDKELRKWRKFLHQFDEKEASEGTTETEEITPVNSTPEVEILPQQQIFHNQLAMQPLAFPMMPFMIQVCF